MYDKRQRKMEGDVSRLIDFKIEKTKKFRRSH